MVQDDVSNWKPICVASTQDDGEQSPGLHAAASVDTNKGHLGDNYFKGTEWSVYLDMIT